MRRSGHLMAAAALELMVVALMYLVIGPGWIARTGWDRGDATGVE